jgi:DNA mismatch repair protein MutS
VLLHRLVRGPANQSYGVAVAKLAGLPASVLSRAGELLANFEGEEPLEVKPPRRGRARKPAQNQLSLFAPAGAPVDRALSERLLALDINRLSPLEALALLADLKGQASG